MNIIPKLLLTTLYKLSPLRKICYSLVLLAFEKCRFYNFTPVHVQIYKKYMKQSTSTGNLIHLQSTILKQATLVVL